LDPANLEFLTIGEDHCKCSPGNRHNPADHVHVDDRASAEANEAVWIQTSSEIPETTANGVSLILLGA